MDTISNLQQQFPLSPRKFWKKIIEKLFIFLFFSLFLTVMIFAVVFTLNILPTKDTWTIVFAIALLFIFFYLVLVLPYIWYVKTYIKRYYYAGEENFITIKKGVFAPTEIHVQWKKIQDVYVDQDILDRIMGLYDVHIASATASSGIEAHIDGVDQASAEGLKKFFLDKMSNTGENSINESVQTNQNKSSSNPEVKTINLSEEISSKIYPLSNKWIFVDIINRAVSSIFIPFLILIIIFGKSKGSSFMEFDWSQAIMIWTASFIIVFVFRIITLFLWKSNYSFKFNKDNIYYKEGVISLSEKHMPYSSIQDVTVNQGIIYRMVGLAEVKIENAANQTVVTKNGAVSVFTGIIIQGLSIADANKITDILKSTVLGRNSNKYGL